MDADFPLCTESRLTKDCCRAYCSVDLQALRFRGSGFAVVNDDESVEVSSSRDAQVPLSHSLKKVRERQQ